MAGVHMLLSVLLGAHPHLLLRRSPFRPCQTYPHPPTQAADKLAPGSPLAGEAFFITNQHPVPFWGFTGDLLEGLGYGRPRIKLPFGLILFVAMLFEYVIRPLLRPIKELSTDFTVFRCGLDTGAGAAWCIAACIHCWRDQESTALCRPCTLVKSPHPPPHPLTADTGGFSGASAC